MKPSLKPGLKHRFAYAVPETKTVPQLYPESPQLRAMPDVFATGFMVGLMEWTCVQLLEPHLDAGEGSLGVHIDVSHKSRHTARHDRHRRCGMHRGERSARQIQSRGA